MIGTAIATVAAAASLSTGLITTDNAALRAAPRDAALQQAQLRQGELVEIRGERQDYLQVWDHQRERGGYVHVSALRRTALTPAEAPEMLAVLRFVRDAAGAETLAIGLAAAYLKAASPEALRGEGGAEAFDALGSAAERLAQRASGATGLSKNAEATLSAHLDVAARYGVRFASYEREGRMQICYDGEAFRRVLAMPASVAQARARAALALTRPECADPALGATQRKAHDQWRAEVLDRVDSQALPDYLAHRVRLRRAGLWAGLAYQQARAGEEAGAAAQRALNELALVRRGELADSDLADYNDAAMRVNASRWAASAATAATAATAAAPSSSANLRIATEAGAQPGETCVALIEARQGAARPLARRCTFAQVWPASASANREGTALALAVQPLEGWRELWVFKRESATAWRIDVLPPAALAPELGYAEFAGWVPGGQQILVAREARAESKYRRSYEIVRLGTLTTERQASEANLLGAFQRWQDPLWKQQSVSLR